MKRGLALVLVCILLLTSSACSGIKLTDPEELEKGKNTTVVRDYEDEDLLTFSDYLAQEETKQEEEFAQKQEQQSVPPTRGTVEGGVYTNEYLGLRFKPTFGFVFYNREEMGELVGQDPAVYSVENLISAESPVDSIYEMMAVDIQNNNVVICYENLGKSGFGNYTEAQYLQSVYAMLAKNSGYHCDWEKRCTQTLGGVEFQMLPVTVEGSGGTMTQGYFIKKYGKYFVQVIITAWPDAYQSILNEFEKLQ